jgi:hypothetical protein
MSYRIKFMAEKELMERARLVQCQPYEHTSLTTIPKGQAVSGREGDRNPRKRIPSASGTDATHTVSVASRFLSSLGSRGVAASPDRSTRTRRWSSASDEFTSAANLPQEIDDPGTLSSIVMAT